MVRVQIRRARDGRLGAVVVERHLQPAGHRRRNFILNREDVVLRPVESFRPQLKTIRRINQLHRDAEPAAGGAHAAGEQSADVQSGSDRGKVGGRTLERK